MLQFEITMHTIIIDNRELYYLCYNKSIPWPFTLVTALAWLSDYNILYIFMTSRKMQSRDTKFLIKIRGHTLARAMYILVATPFSHLMMVIIIIPYMETSRTLI